MTKEKVRAIAASDGSDLPARMTYGEHERDAAHAEKVRLYARAKIGKDWDGKADNDNIAWPLATALIREGNTELLKAALAYRRIHDQAHSAAQLGGKSVSIGNGVALDRYTYLRPNGSVTYRHARQKQSASVDIPAKQYVAPPSYEKLPGAAEEVKVSNWTNIPKPWDGDRSVNDMIDAQRKLDGLRARLGALVEPLEMAAIDGETYQAVGNASGVADRSGSIAAGRAIVHLALITVRDALGNIRRQDLAA